MNPATEIPQAVPAYSRNSSLSHKYDKYSYFRRVGSTFFAPESGPMCLAGLLLPSCIISARAHPRVCARRATDCSLILRRSKSD